MASSCTWRHTAMVLVLLALPCHTHAANSEPSLDELFAPDYVTYSKLAELTFEESDFPDNVTQHDVPTFYDVPPQDILNARLPYLFDYRLTPGTHEACSHCSGDLLSKYRGISWPIEPCCGVCIPFTNPCPMYPWQLEALVDVYRRKGFQIDGFLPSHMFHHIKGRTLWLIGDSQTESLYWAIECFVRQYGLDHINRTIGPFEHDPVHMAKWDSYFNGTGGCKTSFYGWCFPLIHGGRICSIKACIVDLFYNAVLPLLIEGVPAFKDDILMLNAGLHMASDTQLKQQLVNLTAFIAANKEKLPRQLYWMMQPIQHFNSSEGAYSWKGPRPSECSPQVDYFNTSSPRHELMRAGGSRHLHVIEPIMQAAGIRIFSTWNATVPLWFMHRIRLGKPSDCTHYCAPGPIEIWAYMFHKFLEEEEAKLQHMDRKAAAPQQEGQQAGQQQEGHVPEQGTRRPAAEGDSGQAKGNGEGG